jgi:hypothetical protein
MNIEGVARDRSPSLLFLCSIVFVLVGSYFPAVMLSFYSGSVGFGCRCLAWTMIAISWVLSLTIDNTMKLFIPTAKKLWGFTIAKDFLFSVFVVGTVLFVQTGFLNSCYCRANPLTSGEKAGVNLGPFSDSEWKRNWVVWPTATVSGFCVMLTFGYLAHVLDVDRQGSGWRVRFANGILCKGEKERHEDLLGICQLRRECQRGTLPEMAVAGDAELLCHAGLSAHSGPSSSRASVERNDGAA